MKFFRFYTALLLVLFFLCTPIFLEKGTISLGDAFHGISWKFPLGATPLGESILTEIILGAKTTLTLSALALVVCLAVSLFFAVFLFQLPKSVQNIFAFFIDALLSIPSIFIALSIGYFLPQSFMSVFIALALSEFAALQKFFLQRMQDTQQVEFLRASRVMGASLFYQAKNHILPRLVRDAGYLLLITFPSIVLSLASLEFLGVQTGSAELSLGMQIALYKDYIFLYPLLSLAPVVCILLILLTLNEAAKRTSF